jgi:hypothetical protein
VTENIRVGVRSKGEKSGGKKLHITEIWGILGNDFLKIDHVAKVKSNS